MWLQIFLTVEIQLCEDNEKQQFVMVSGDINLRSGNLAPLRRKAQSEMAQHSPRRVTLSMFDGSAHVSAISTTLSVEKK